MQKILKTPICCLLLSTPIVCSSEVAWKVVVPGYSGKTQTHGMSPTLFSPSPTKTHIGVDIIADCGEEIFPLAEGKVVARNYRNNNTDKSQYHYATGSAVIVEHPDLNIWTVYFHMEDSPQVNLGQNVSPSTVLGTVGNTGAGSGACHTHFEIRKFHDENFAGGWFNYSATQCNHSAGTYPCGDVSDTQWFQKDYEDPLTYQVVEPTITEIPVTCWGHICWEEGSSHACESGDVWYFSVYGQFVPATSDICYGIKVEIT